MPRPPIARYRSLLCLLTTALLLAACTRVGLVYRNLDTLIPWSVDDYVDMSRDQESDFRGYLRDHLAWHCSTQLPRYLEWLDRLEHDPVTRENLRARYLEAREALDVIAREVTPTTVDLLGRLDDEQARRLLAKLDEDHRKRLDEYLDPPLDEQIEKRAERVEKRLADWLGRLNDAQRARIRQWAQALGDHNSRWLASRALWQQAFKEAIEQRHAPDFPARIERLLQDREAFWAPDYREAFHRNETAGIDLAVDVYALADERQRRHLAGRIDAIRRDLSGLECLQKSAARPR